MAVEEALEERLSLEEEPEDLVRTRFMRSRKGMFAVLVILGERLKR